MHALITGGAGFIGSHLAEALLAAGHRVTALDNLSTGSEDNVAHLLSRGEFTLVTGSVRDEAQVAAAIDGCEVVFHLAAAVGVDLIIKRPVHTIETNIHGTEVVLAAAARSGCKVLLASTSEVYGKGTRAPFREDDDSVLGPTGQARWSYACSKMADEFLALAYHDQFHLPVVIARIFNTIGPRQTGQYGMVVPRFVRSALADQPLEIYGTGEQSRCFCNVCDLVGGLIALAACDDAVGQVVNLGTDQPITINALADRITQLTGSASETRHLTYEQAYGRHFDDMLIRIPDLSRAESLIAYAPAQSLDETLREVIAFEGRP